LWIPQIPLCFIFFIIDNVAGSYHLISLPYINKKKSVHG
jgi:hypothetical protein